MTAAELRDLLVREIVKTQGGGAARWRKAVGRVKAYPRATHAHCNWEVQSMGSTAEIAAVERMADALRARWPYIDEP